MQPAIWCQTLSILFLWYSTQAPFFPWEASINLSPFHQQTSKSITSCDPGTRKHMKTLYITILVGGFNHLEKYEFVNGKDDIPYMMESHKIHVPNHQPVFKSNETILDMLTVRPCWLVQLWVNSGPWDNHGAINDHIFGTIRRG